MASRISFGTRGVDVFTAADLLGCTSLEVTGKGGECLCFFRREDGLLHFRNCTIPPDLQEHVCSMEGVRHLSITNESKTKLDVSVLLRHIHKLDHLESLVLEGCAAAENECGGLPVSLERLCLFDSDLDWILQKPGARPHIRRLGISLQRAEHLNDLAPHLDAIRELDVHFAAGASHAQFMYGLYLCITLLPGLERLSCKDADYLIPYPARRNLPVELETSFSHLPACRDLSASKLQYLEIMGDSMRTLPEYVHRLAELSELTIQSDHLTSLGNGLCSLQKLEALDLCGCGRLGSLPECLYGMNSLQWVNLTETGVDVGAARKAAPDVEFVDYWEEIEEMEREEEYWHQWWLNWKSPLEAKHPASHSSLWPGGFVSGKDRPA